MPDALIAKLEHVLAQEKLALLSAEFDALDRLAPDKAALISRLASIQPDKMALQNIAAKLDENQTLLAAAIKGVTAARERLEALHHVQKTLSVYDHSGRIEFVPNRRPALEKKA
jgi:flagellar biosynthesis/type III secretory pathway chaperone